MAKIIRVTTAPIALKYLLAGQLKFMQENGMEVLAVSADGPERKDIIEKEGVRHIIIPMARSISPFKDLKCLFELIFLFKKERPDIVHSHTPKAGLLAMMAAKIAGIKIRIHTVAGLRYRTTTGFTKSLLVAMERLTYACSNHLWPNSNSIKAIVQDIAPRTTGKIDMIGMGSSNGIDLERFSPNSILPGRLAEIKKGIDYDASITYFLVIGRIVKDKGIEDVYNAFEKIHSGRKNTALIIVGQFENDLDPIDPIIKQKMLVVPFVKFVHFSDEVEYYLSLANFIIHPSHREGFPNVLLQAGAMKCPVICSEIEGNVDIIDDRKTGLLFKPKDPESIVQTVDFALNNKELVLTMAENLFQKIYKFYERRNYHQLLLKKYKKLLS